MVLINGWAAQWIKEGMPRWLSNRTACVQVNGVKVMACYSPLWKTNEAELAEMREEVEEMLRNTPRKTFILVGGDFNANIGRIVSGGQNATRGIFGTGEANEAGINHLEWIEDSGLCAVDSFFKIKKRGTWHNRFNGRWYELDGFMCRQEERARKVKRVRTKNNIFISDHKPKEAESEAEMQA